MKKIIILLALLLVSVISVSAWHCTETDTGAYGWFFTPIGPGEAPPDGCRFYVENGNYLGNCTNKCSDTTYREFTCADIPGTVPGTESGIIYADYPNSEQCLPPETPGVPEWSTMGALGVLAIAGLFIYRKRK